MSEKLEKEGIFPTGAFDFLTDGGLGRVVANDVERQPSQDSEVLGRVVLSDPVGVFGEDNVEDPMQTVLDAPVTAHALQQSLGRDVFREQVVSHGRLLGPPAMDTSARCDAGQGSDSGKAVCRGHAGVANVACRLSWRS